MPNYTNCVLPDLQPIDQVHLLQLWIALHVMAQNLAEMCDLYTYTSSCWYL